MKISDCIYLSTVGKDPEDLTRLKRRLTYANPTFEQTKRLGFSTFSIPRTIQTFEETEGVLRIMRGEISHVREIFPDDLLEEAGTENPVKLSYENKDFELDPFQKEAVRAMTTKKQGIIHASTSAGKTHIVLAAAAALGQKTLILVHRKILMEQFVHDIRKYVKSGVTINIGRIGDGVCKVGPQITVALVQTFEKRMNEIDKDFGVVFLDECHLVAANTFQYIMNHLAAARRYGLTGTMKRKDKKEFLIYATFGRVIATIAKETLLAAGRVTPIELKVHETEFCFDYDKIAEERGVSVAWNETMNALHADVARREFVTDLVTKLDGPVLVLLNRVNAVYDYATAYVSRGFVNHGIITGANSSLGAKVCAQMNDGTLRVVFATVGCVSTGVDIPNLRHVVLATPIFSNEGLIHQIRGRLMRKAEGKEKGLFHFIFDPFVFPRYKLLSFLRLAKK